MFAKEACEHLRVLLHFDRADLRERKRDETDFVRDSLLLVIEFILVKRKSFLVDLSQKLLPARDQHVLFGHNELH